MEADPALRCDLPADVLAGAVAAAGCRAIGEGALFSSEALAALTGGGDKSAISGSYNNLASEYGAVVAGGGWNTASGHLSVVLGGALNTASGYMSTVQGGYSQENSGTYSYGP